MNQKITETERMYSMICETSNNAFFYYNYQTKQLNILGKWNDFFDCDIKDINTVDGTVQFLSNCAGVDIIRTFLAGYTIVIIIGNGSDAGDHISKSYLRPEKERK